MTELTDLANSIAQSKEEIRQAIEERGMPCSVSVPFADYADKIRNMTVTNYVDSIYATNYTGATISEGDKVFLNKKGLDSTSSFMTTKSGGTSSSSYISLVDTSGNVTWQSFNGYIYNNNNGNIIASSAIVNGSNKESDSLTQFFPKYDCYGRMYWRDYVFQNGIVTQRSTIFLNDDYDIKYYSSSTENVSLYKMNRATNEVIKTISLTTSSTLYPGRRQSFMIDNNVYIPGNASGSTSQPYYRFEINDIDSSSSGIYSSNYDYYSVFHYITPDGKYCFNSKNEYSSISNSPLCFDIKAYEIRNGDLYQQKVFNNPKLMDILNSRCWLSFNEQTGILCAMKNNNTAFGVFKYENEDFTTIPIEISASEIPQNQNCVGMSISDDFSALNLRDKTFKLVQSPDGSYKAINYSKGLTEDVLTGIAQADAENGERFEVITLFPPEIATTVRVKVEGNEPANITQTIVE